MKKMKIRVTLFIILATVSLLQAENAVASTVEVEARCVRTGPNDNSNNNLRTFEFRVRYFNSDLHISRAELVNGMAAWGNNGDLPGGGWRERWSVNPTVSLTNEGSGRFSATQSRQEGSGFFFLDFRFAIRMIGPNGNVMWDNAGRGNGFYNVQLKANGLEDLLPCGENTQFSRMRVSQGS